MPPIIDRTLFEAALAALAGHISVLRDGGAYRQTFLMAGLVRCAHCSTRGRPGHNIVTPRMRRSKGRKYPYYICNKSLLPYLQKEECRRVIDALNVTVSVKGMKGKPKATLHWWRIDAPLSLDGDTPSGGQGSASGSGSGNEVNGTENGYGDLPILRAIRHMGSS
jgi:hypothetical protein